MKTSASAIPTRVLPSWYAQMTFTADHLEQSTHARTFIKRYARIMDRRWADALLGLLWPLVDVWLWVIHSLVSVYRAYQVNLPHATLAKILARHWVDVAIGFVPVVWDLLDFWVRSNLYAQEQFAMHHDAMMQTMIEQWVQLDGEHATSSWIPSERYRNRSVEWIRSSIEDLIDKHVLTPK